MAAFRKHYGIVRKLTSHVFIFGKLFPVNPDGIPVYLQHGLISVFTDKLLFLLLFFLIIHHTRDTQK